MNKRKIIITLIECVLGLLHIVGLGCHSSDEMFILSTSYFSDLALPFGFYFLLKLSEDKISLLGK
jgi:hypothetical protein